jgi:hypothetical protein
LQIKIDQYEQRNYQVLNNSANKEILKLEDSYRTMLGKKERTIQELLKYKNLIYEELKVIKQIINNSYKNDISR